MKKIGIDCRIFGSSGTGIARYTYHLVKELLNIDKENQYILFTVKDNEHIKEFLNYNNVKVVFVDAKHYSFKEQLIFPFILYKHKLDLMHFTHFNAPLLYFGNIIVTIHDLILHFFPGQNKKSIIHKIAYYLTIKSIVKKSKIIISVSQNTKKDIINVLKIDENKINVIYESIDTDKFFVEKNESILNKTKQKYRLPDNYLLYIGVFRKHKNVDSLIKAFKILKKDNYHNNLHLVLVGPKSADYEVLVDLIKKEGIENFVHFTGLVSDEELNHIINMAKLFVFPSLYEGFGLPALEAMSCGTPVVISNKTSLPEIAQDAAYYFDPENIEDIAKKIDEVLKDPILQDSLIMKGFNHIKKFSWKKMAQQTFDLYQMIIK